MSASDLVLRVAFHHRHHHCLWLHESVMRKCCKYQDIIITTIKAASHSHPFSCFVQAFYRLVDVMAKFKGKGVVN